MADLIHTTKAVLTHVLEKKSLPDIALLKLFIAQALGYSVLLGACITKVPQIMVILKAGTARGLSEMTYEIETYALLVSALYGYTKKLPFNTYGESTVLAVQNLIILYMVYGYSRTPYMRRLAVMAAYVALIAGVFTGHITPLMMSAFAEANTAVAMASRLPQVFKNLMASSTGALSGVTVFINVVGCIVRVFTTIQAGAGPILLRSYITSLVIHSIMLVQILLYRKNTAAQLQQEKEQHAKEVAAAKKSAAGPAAPAESKKDQ